MKINKERLNFTGIYSDLLCIYLFTLLCFYPYGLMFGENSFRVSDLVSISLVGLGLIQLVKTGRANKAVLFLFVVSPFFLMEIVTPILGSFLHNGLFLMASFKVLLSYLPMIFLFVFYNYKNFWMLDKRIEKLMKVSLFIQLAVSIIQIMVIFGYLPPNFLLQSLLEPWAVDNHYKFVDGVRASGLANNGIELSMIGILLLIYFTSKLMYKFENKYLFYSILSLTLIILTTTRAAILAAIIIILCCLIFARISWISKGKFLTTLIVAVVGLLILINYTLGLDELFYRFLRIGNEGLANDFSYSFRNEVLWPNVLEGLRSYPHGTLINPYEIFGVIDSGYLSYFAQGTYLFALTYLIFIIGCFSIALIGILRNKNVVMGVFMVNIVIYITIAMYFYNLMRLPLIIFFILYSLAGLAIQYPNSFVGRPIKHQVVKLTK
jgi:hypothetical protein